MSEQEIADTTKLPAERRADMLANEDSMFFNVALFEQAQRVATLFANSTMVPEHFQQNVGNCMIALNYAARLRADPFMVMQSMYVVYGRPGIEGKLVGAAINTSGKYSEPLKYKWLDPEDKEVDRNTVLRADIPSEYGIVAWTKDAKTGEVVEGPKITWKLVKNRGWYDKKGPDKTLESNNWRTMPEMMFVYRSESWFANKHCPEVKLGMPTVEELRDHIELEAQPDGSFAAPQATVTGQLLAESEELEEGKWPCPHCEFVSEVSERGLKKHIAQQHPLETEAAKKHFDSREPAEIVDEKVEEAPPPEDNAEAEPEWFKAFLKSTKDIYELLEEKYQHEAGAKFNEVLANHGIEATDELLQKPGAESIAQTIKVRLRELL